MQGHGWRANRQISEKLVNTILPLFRGIITNQLITENIHKCTRDHYIGGNYNIKLPDCLSISDIYIMDHSLVTKLRPFRGTKIKQEIQYWSQIRPLVQQRTDPQPKAPKQPSSTVYTEEKQRRTQQYKRLYRQREDVKQHRRLYCQREDVKERRRERAKEKKQRLK